MDDDPRDERRPLTPPVPLPNLADEMEWDGMPAAARWLHRIIEPSMMAEWRMTEARREVRWCFVWGTLAGVVLTLAVWAWGRRF